MANVKCGKKCCRCRALRRGWIARWTIAVLPHNVSKPCFPLTLRGIRKQHMLLQTPSCCAHKRAGYQRIHGHEHIQTQGLAQYCHAWASPCAVQYGGCSATTRSRASVQHQHSAQPTATTLRARALGAREGAANARMASTAAVPPLPTLYPITSTTSFATYLRHIG